MKVQIYSDFRCPFCYIGKRHLEQAIEKSGLEVEIEMMSYELDPTIQPDPSETVAQHIAKKYGISEDEAKSNNTRVVFMAKEAGLNYDFDRVIDVNTLSAHRVFQKAKEVGVGNAFAELGMSGYFEKGLNLDDEATLVELGLQAGMTADAVKEALNHDEYAYQVRQDEQLAQQIGVQGVPYFVMDNKVSLSGAQPVDTFIQAMKYTASLQTPLQQEDNLTCEDGSCEI